MKEDVKNDPQKTTDACVGIIGLGLMGGSLAKAFRNKAGVRRIVAIDKDSTAIEAALGEGIIDEGTTPDDELSLLSGCDLVILCVPIFAIEKLKPALARLDIGILTDVASVKKPVMELIDFSNFIGGHPMAGSERHGYACSRTNLFENALYILCLPDNSTVSAVRIQWFKDLIVKIGAKPMQMRADEHDRQVAAISHLPHVAAAALSNLAASLDDGALCQLAAGGFRDITRIASSDPRLWADISLASRDDLLEVLDVYRDLLTYFSDALKARSADELESFFAKGAFYRNRLPLGQRGALEASCTMTVFLEDKPGELGAITTLLGQKKINIKNIHIRDFRDYEHGQLSLLLADHAQAVEAYAILREAGYECE